MNKYVLQKGFITQKVGQKITIFDGEKSQLYTFNPVGTFIFEKLKKGLDDVKIINLITKHYEISYTKAEKDFNEFILDLKKKKIL